MSTKFSVSLFIVEKMGRMVPNEMLKYTVKTNTSLPRC